MQLAAHAQTAAAPVDWPRLPAAMARDAAQERRIAQMVAGMTLAQKVGQMTQPDIRHATPDQVRQFFIGSVLNGGGGWPGGNKHASLADWLALAQAYHAASMASGMAVPVPLLWGTDAVHGHNNVLGATIFPHNIGLGATRDPALVHEIGAATARAVRASGLQWVFAPTLAVVRDDRWGRSYESFSEDPALVALLGAAAVQGLQGRIGAPGGFGSEHRVVATAKHFIGDGGTEAGQDQGINRASRAQMVAIHGAGHYSALAAGVQTVMASFHSWQEAPSGGGQAIDHGKLHGSRWLLTEVLKDRLGFDGFVVSDWNGVGQVPGCSDTRCAAAINAGIDMVMVPEDWRAFIADTIALVQAGEIPLARIDDAVTRILRVKLRAGLFNSAPAQNALAGRADALSARALARRAVRQSLVLLKNHHQLLPLARSARLLVVGKGAHSLQHQTGGWSLTWQGTDNHNADFPNGDTLLDGLRQALGEGRVVFSEDASGVDVRGFDAVVAVLGEAPYAEGRGDIPPAATLHHASRHPEDLAVLQRVAGHGVPVATVFLSGRPLYVNDLLNLSDAFVAAWLPGTEGAGVADLLLRAADGSVAHTFSGRLPFSWPRAACQTPLNAGDPGADPLFALGYGLDAGRLHQLGPLDTSLPRGGCGAANALVIFNGSAVAPFTLHLASLDGLWPDQPLGDDLNALVEQPAGRPAVRVRTVQVNTQQDGRRVQWLGPARLLARAAQPLALDGLADAALVFDTVLWQAPEAPVTLMLASVAGGGTLHSASVDLTRLFKALPLQQRQRINIPLSCLVARGLDLRQVHIPFSLSTRGPFDAAVAAIHLQAGAARDADALSCDALLP